jgi:hypothetical protein
LSPRLASLLSLVLVAVTAVFALRSASAPTAQSASAPAGVFSAGRARGHLEHIAAVAHPVGSRAHGEVREYLLRTLRDLGVEPEVQATSAVRLSPKASILGSTVHNVLALLKGTEGRGVIAIVAHYDSVPTSPGASDDGAGVAAMLETLRALRAGPPLRNDVLFLFTDAEETGLVGTQAFALQHPLAKRVDTVLNFEARGSSGPALMFQSGPGNRWIIEHLTRSGAPVLASSLFDEVYRRLTADTDFSVFLEQGRRGLNFGFIHGFMRYHTRTDDLAHLDPDSLQHHGELMLSLARELGNTSLETASTDNAHFFNVGPFLVHHPASWTAPLALLALISVGAVLVAGTRRGRLRGSGLAWSVAAWLAVTVGSGAVVLAAWWLMKQLDGGLKALPQRDAYQAPLFMSGLMALTLAAVAFLQSRFLRKAHRLEMAAVALAVWSLLGAIAAFTIPGASHMFSLPALSCAAGLAVWLHEPHEGAGPLPRLLLALSTVPALLLWVPGVPLASSALTLALSPVVAFCVASGLALVLPLLAPEPVRTGRTVALPALTLACALLGVGLVKERFDADTPRPSSLTYAVDASRREAWWLTGDFEPDAWVSGVLGTPVEQRLADALLPLYPREVRITSAPLLPLREPGTRVERDDVRDGLRTLALRLTPGPDMAVVQAQLRKDTPLRGLSFAGHALSDSELSRVLARPRGAVLEFWAAPPEGVRLELSVPEGTRVGLRVTGVRFDLDSAPGAPAARRPADTEPAPFRLGLPDQTLVGGEAEY